MQWAKIWGHHSPKQNTTFPCKLNFRELFSSLDMMLYYGLFIYCQALTFWIKSRRMKASSAVRRFALL